MTAEHGSVQQEECYTGGELHRRSAMMDTTQRVAVMVSEFLSVMVSGMVNMMVNVMVSMIVSVIVRMMCRN